MVAPDHWQVSFDADEKGHKENCQRAFTFQHQQFNCVLTIEIASQKGKSYRNNIAE